MSFANVFMAVVMSLWGCCVVFCCSRLFLIFRDEWKNR